MNVEWLAAWPAPVRRGLYFGLQRAIGSNIGRVWREFLRWEQFDAPTLQHQVERRLARLLEHATQHSDYYRSLPLPAAASSQSAVDRLHHFPILTRDTVRNQFARLVADPLREQIQGPQSSAPKGYDWLIVKTGGSTGVPTSVVHDRVARDWGRATRLYALRLAGFPLGVPYFRLWGSEQDLWNQQVKFSQRMLRALHAEQPLNAFRAQEADLRSHYQRMRARPDILHLMTYVDAAVSLAWFINDHRLDPPRFKSIMACAGTVTPEYRKVLESTFSAAVINKYGSRECCDMACECRHHTGLHVYSPNVYLEVVDEKGCACPPGVTGRVLVTLLNNLSFPMIRYEIGDVADWAPAGDCPCGSPFPRLSSIAGRQDDLLTTQDGTSVTSVFVRHFVGVSLNRELIREWQLEQQTKDDFQFRYIPLKREGLDENLEALRRSFAAVFGQAARIRFEQVTAIPPSPSGKVRWIVNRYRTADR